MENALIKNPEIQAHIIDWEYYLKLFVTIQLKKI
jgi:hypothetical protein